MKAVFDLRSITSDWAPPFEKKVSENQHIVSEGESFGEVEKRQNEFVFKLLSLKSDKALIEFHHEFLVKGYGQHPAATKQIWVELNEPKEFTFQWSNKGTTKKLTLKAIKPDM